jgi:hypothetical protein
VASKDQKGQNPFNPNWNSTFLRLNQNCEDWKVPSDHRGVTFEEWVEGLPLQLNREEITLAESAWRASITHHTATLRRIGWIDQKGRVWLEVPSAKDFDGGSLTPLLVDVRGDD